MVFSRDAIIITTLNEESNIKRLLDSIEIYTDSALVEVIVVDDGSSDNTLAIADQYANVTTITTDRKTLRGEGRNIGMENTDADTYIFLDADTVITESWFSELKRSLSVFDIVAGFSPAPDNKQSLPRVPIIVKGQDVTYPTCNIAYKKSVIDDIGFFRTDLVTAEDIDLNYRAVLGGYLIGYNPHMVVYHYHRNTKKGFLKQAYWNGFGRFQLNRTHPQLKHQHYHGLQMKNFTRLTVGLFGLVTGRFLSKTIS